MADKLYTCYETNQTMTQKAWFFEFYLTKADRTEYPTFSDWWYDMTEKSHVLEEVK